MGGDGFTGMWKQNLLTFYPCGSSIRSRSRQRTEKRLFKEDLCFEGGITYSCDWRTDLGPNCSLLSYTLGVFQASGGKRGVLSVTQENGKMAPELIDKNPWSNRTM